jgi:triosephosphate isomerase (TIM)
MKPTSTSSRQRIVAGNWKMHGSRADNQQLVEGLLAPGTIDDRVTCVLCPPFVYLVDVARAVKGTSLHLGAQDVCAENQHGAYTGEVSATMLHDVGCEYTLVGHSERRALPGENDGMVARKFAAVQARGMTPILCFGEQLNERDEGRSQAVVGRQLDAVLAIVGVAALAKAVLAYEPIWAIGTGRTASPDQAQEIHAFIRGRVAVRDASIAAGLRVLYGGSVKGSNAAELFAMPDVDGGLVGGASLKAEEFLAIWSAAADA